MPLVLSKASEQLLAAYKAEGREDVVALVKELGSIRRQAPVAHLTFPVSPPEHTLETMADWFRSNVHPNALLTVSVDRTLLGGMVVRTTDKYFDFSFSTALGANRNLIPKAVRHAR